MTTLEKLKAKSESFFGSKVRMPSIPEIAKMLEEMDINFTLSDSVNIVEYRSKGNRYVNSRHRGKEGKKLIIKPSELDSNKSGIHYIELDSSDSYYSWNTSRYASKIIDLLKSTGKI